MKENRDAQLKISRALPNGAANVTSTGIDTGKTTALGSQPGSVEYLLTAPAMNTTQMPDAKTMKYDLIAADSADLTSNPTTLVTTVLTQTGAASAGCATATYRFRAPTSMQRYLGIKATGSGSGDASGASATLEALI